MEIQLETSQNQVLSQKMLQSIEILQMSAQELTDYMSDMALENPVIDMEQTNWEDKDQERLKKLEWLDSLDEQNRIYYRQEYEDYDSDDVGNMGDGQPETLADNLLSQLIGGEYSKEEFEIFEYIAECLDARGFYTGTYQEIAEEFHIPDEQAKRYLDIMKGLDPAGVCAQSLSECLERQLERKGVGCEVEREIVTTYLETLGKNQLQLIAKKLNQPIERIIEAKNKIQSLNPSPACGFSSREVLRYLTPDVTVVKLADYFEVFVNDCSYPALRVNKDYMQMLKSDCPDDVKQYICEKAKQIETVQSCIGKRNHTLLELTKCIVESQKDFFLLGKGHLVSYQMREAAQKLGIHESTISRAVKEKYLQCCWGIFPLGMFFSKGFYKRENQADMTTEQIKKKLQSIIEYENKEKPYSDQKLADEMSRQGITISRRTIAKYREGMGIPDCRGRKYR